MNKIARIISIILAVALLAACGDEAYTTNNNAPAGGNPPVTPGPGVPEKPNPSKAASIRLEAPTLNLSSSKDSSLELSARVLDDNGVVVEGETVAFSIPTAVNSGGELQVLNNGITSATGIAKAILSTTNDPSNRTIPVTASINGTQSILDVAVSGTTLTVSGDTTLVLGSATTLTVFLKDSAGNGIGLKNISVTSEANNFQDTFITTNSSGQAQFDVTISQPTNDVIAVEGLGAQAIHRITISNDLFTFVSSTPAEMDIDKNYDITVNWQSGGRPKVGAVVNFSVSRGVLSGVLPNPASPTTDAQGNATVTINSKSFGPVVITASAANGPTINVESEFVAVLPNSLTIQADQITIGPNGQQSAITATVRDANSNLVKNVPVLFTIIEDNSGGNILNTFNITDSLGKASTIYQSSASSTKLDGIKIRARTAGTPCNGPAPTSPLCADITLTVSDSALYVTLGTTDEIGTTGLNTMYSKVYSVGVNDAAGNGKANAVVEFTLTSVYYRTGYRTWNTAVSKWLTVESFPCKSEDLNLNDNLDAGEDLNGNGDLDPGKIATVTATVVTDSDGWGQLFILYPKEFALYVGVKLTAVTKVDTTEGTSTVEFDLPIAVDDINSKDSVPGFSSRWGEINNCNQGPIYRQGTAPTSLTATTIPTTVTNPGGISLNWEQPFSVTAYKVYRNTGNGTIDITDPNTYSDLFETILPPYMDVAPPAGTYNYVVTAIVGGVVLRETGPSDQASATFP